MYGRTFSKTFAVRMVHTPGDAYAAAATDGTWVDMTGFRRCVFLPMAGELDGDLAMSVYEATSAAGAGAQEVDGTNLADSFVNGTDEDLPGVFEVRADDLTTGYNYVTLRATPTSTDAFGCLALLYDAYEEPVTNTVATHVAFVAAVDY